MIDGSATGALQRAGVAGLAALIFAAPLFFVRGLYDFSNVPKAAFLQVGVLVVLALAAWAAADREELRWRPSPLVPAVAALLAWSALSLLWSVDAHAGLARLATWTAAALAGVLVLQLARDDDSLRLLARAGAASGVAVALVGLLQALFGFDAIPQPSSPGATFGNPNLAAHHVALTLPLVVWGWSRAPTSAWRFGNAMAGGAMAAYLVHCLTKAAWLAAVVGLVVQALASRSARAAGSAPRNERSRLASLVAAGVVAVVLALPAVLPSADEGDGGGASVAAELGSAFTPGGSLAERLAIWRNTLALVAERPVHGVGLGNFGVHYPRVAAAATPDLMVAAGRRVERTHDDYLQILAELGAVGLALALAIVAVAVRLGVGLVGALRDAARDDPTGERLADAAALTAAALGGLATFAVIATFSFPLQRPTPPLVLALLLGLLAALAAARASRPERILRVPRTGGRVAAVAVVVVAALAMIAHRDGFQAQRHLRTAVAARKAGSWPLVLDQARALLDLRPRHGRARVHEGAALRALGRDDEAVTALQAALVRRPHDHAALTDLCASLRRLGRHDEAELRCQQVLTSYPAAADAHRELGLSLMSRGRHAEAEEHFAEALAARPGSAQLTYNLGAARYALGDDEGAREAFLGALDAGPKPKLAARAHHALGDLCMRGGDPACALSHHEASARLHDTGKARQRLGHWAEVGGRRPEAIQHLRRALELGDLGSLELDVQLRLGRLHFALGQRDAARTAWQRALQLDPASAEARDGLARAPAR